MRFLKDFALLQLCYFFYILCSFLSYQILIQFNAGLPINAVSEAVGNGITIDRQFYLLVLKVVVIEELLFRGIPFAFISWFTPRIAYIWVIALTSSIIFGSLHGMNAGAILIPGTGGLILFWFGYYFLKRNNWLTALLMCLLLHIQINTVGLWVAAQI